MTIKGLRLYIRYNENRQMKYFYLVCRDRGSHPEGFQAVWMGVFVLCHIPVDLIKKIRILVILEILR
jgi:hypothetical protein